MIYIIKRCYYNYSRKKLRSQDEKTIGSLLIFADRNRKWPPFARQALAVDGNAFPLLDGFLGHQAKGDDEPVDFARHVAVVCDRLPVNIKVQFVLAPVVADAVAVGLPRRGLDGKFVEVAEIFRL